MAIIKSRMGVNVHPLIYAKNNPEGGNYHSCLSSSTAL